MRVNPIVRGDLRARTSGGKAIGAATLFLSVLAVLTILSLPPELGRRSDVRQQDVLQVFLTIEALFIIYVAAAMASGEIAVEGEKAPWDLAASPFPAGAIARGKVITSAAHAAFLAVLAMPLGVIVAGIRGSPLAPIIAAGGMTMAAAAAVGVVGALYSTMFESAFSRSAVHWMTLLLVILGPTVGEGAWRFISPLHAVPAAFTGDPVGITIALATYAGLIVVGAGGLTARIDAIRREAQAA